MSNDAEAFLEKIALDENLRNKVASSNGQEILRIASDMGFSFQPAELNAALESALGASEIPDEQLEAIAGGKKASSFMSPEMLTAMKILQLKVESSK